MFYPLFINLKGKKVLVLGGGQAGTKRALTLRKHGADVTIVSKTFTKKLSKERGVRLIKKEVVNIKDLPDLSGFFMIVTASDDKKLNEEAGNARKNGVLVNRADSHERGDVVFPLVSNVCGHTMAYTTLGENPKLLKKIKKLIEDEFARK